jgi:cytochrome b pre-mRNA-processing protein 3
MPGNAAKQGRMGNKVLGWLTRLLGGERDTVALRLYNGVIERARAPHWYEAGGVPDTLDGRFDMVAAVLALVLLRLEGDAESASVSARLTERFVTDMDGQLRESGIGDIGVGKHIGKMMSMLGGRLGAYRDGLAMGDLTAALQRNLYRGVDPTPPALAHPQAALIAFRDALAATPAPAMIAGDLP